MCSVDHVKLYGIAGGTLTVDLGNVSVMSWDRRYRLSMYHEFLLQVVTVVVVLASIDIPAPNFIAIHAIILLRADEVRKVVLCDIPRAIRRAPGLILDLVLRQVVSQLR